MRTDDFRPSENVEDNREASASRGGLPGGAGGLGIGTVVIIGLISWYFGIDPSVLLNGAQILTGNGSSTQQTSPAPPVTAGAPTEPTGKFVALVLGSGAGGKLLSWHLAASGRRTAVVERKWIGGSCPNVNCLPSKNEVWSAKVVDLIHHAAKFGLATSPAGPDMGRIRQRKRDMVEGLDGCPDLRSLTAILS